MEAAVKNRYLQDGEHGSKISDAESQCDLTTEFYEKRLSEEKHKYDLLNEELCVKVNLISELTTTLNATKSNLDAEVTCLKDKIFLLQVNSEMTKFIIEK